MDTSDITHAIATVLSYIIVYGGLFVALPIFLFKRHKKKKQQRQQQAQAIAAQRNAQQTQKQTLPPPSQRDRVVFKASDGYVTQGQLDDIAEQTLTNKVAVNRVAGEAIRQHEQEQAEPKINLRIGVSEEDQKRAREWEENRKHEHYERSREHFEEVTTSFERFLIFYTYEKFVLNENFYVYVVEDSYIYAFCLINDNYPSAGKVEIYELTYSDLFKDKTKHDRNMILELGYFDSFNEFDFMETNNPVTNYVNEKLPELDLIERILQWEGIPYNYIVFETEDENGNIGRVCFNMTSNLVTKKSHEIADEIQNRIIFRYNDEMKKEIGQYDHIKEIANKENLDIDKAWLKSKKLKDNIDMRIEDSFKRIMFERILRTEDSENIIIKNDLTRIFDDRVKIFSFKKPTKISPKRYVDNNLAMLQELSRGSYHDVEREQYTPIEGKWKNEELMYQCISNVFKDDPVIYQHHPHFLDRQSYDVFVPKLNLAFEYQGKQHFEPVEFFGGEENFKGQVERDKRKKTLSDKNGVTLIYVNYNEEVTEELIRKKIADAGIEL